MKERAKRGLLFFPTRLSEQRSLDCQFVSLFPMLMNCFPLCHSASLFSSEILLYEWNIANCIINLKKSFLVVGRLNC